MVGALVGYGTSVLFPPRYTASAPVLLSGQWEERELLTQVEIATMSAVVDRTAAALGWKGVSGSELRERVSARPTDGNIIKISGTADTPERAQRLADRTAREFVAFAARLTGEGTDPEAATGAEALRRKVLETDRRITELAEAADPGRTVESVQARTTLAKLLTALETAMKKLDEADPANGRTGMVVMAPADRPTGAVPPTRPQLIAAGALLFLLSAVIGHLAAARVNRRLRTEPEIASAFRAWPRVAERWGFARRSAYGGVKALFTGESGTGKTLSAEIVTGMLGLELLKVDLAQVISKWVGETEKNLEAAFRQAEESHAVLLFDEADAVFGKRGEVKQGTDRYANLEVGYLLQRLETSDGLVILTSNLKENIDPAFTRRFHFVVHFPRPAVPERRRLWSLAFPPEAPLAPDVDLDALARLDMTGAGIAAAARTAALRAADGDTGDGDGTVIAMRDVVRGVARQFQREARLLRPSELAEYAGMLREDG